jgi:F-type H+-transporting ATPase subunit epsilon
MANGKIKLEVVTPLKRLVSVEVDEIAGPGSWGEFGVLPEHTPYLVQLDVGALSYLKSSGRYFVSVSGGYAEVGPHEVTILAETAELAEEIDVERARGARERAIGRLSGKDTDEPFNFDRAESSLKRAIGRISVANRSGLE